MAVLSARMSVCHLCAWCTQSPKEYIVTPATGVRDSCDLPCGSSIRAASARSPEPFLQPHTSPSRRLSNSWVQADTFNHTAIAQTLPDCTWIFSLPRNLASQGNKTELELENKLVFLVTNPSPLLPWIPVDTPRKTAAIWSQSLFSVLLSLHFQGLIMAFGSDCIHEALGSTLGTV